MEWYFIDPNAQGDARRKGPWSSVQMFSFAERAVITPETLVWNATLPDWQPWSTQVDSAKADLPPEPLVPSPEIAAAHPMARRRPFAGFWIRAAALLIDGFILQVAYLIFYPILHLLGTSEEQIAQGDSLPMLLALAAAQITIAAAYHVWFVKKYAGTPGKILLGLSVVCADGSPMTWGRSLGRYFATWLSSLTLGIGYLLAAFDDEKRSLHDHVAKTRVLRKE